MSGASHMPFPLESVVVTVRMLEVLFYRHRLHRVINSEAEWVVLWHWAVFVLHYVEDAGRRKEAVEFV